MWTCLLPSLPCSLPGEDEAGMLRRLLTHLEDGGSGGEGADRSTAAPAPAQAAALLQRLSSLVQAGLPMAKRGTFWRLFLNVDTKRQEGEYARLVAEVQTLEQRLHAVASPAGAAPSPLGTGKAAAAERSYQQQGLCAGAAPGTVTLVADASSNGAAAAGPHPPLLYPQSISTFSVEPLHEEDSSPDATPIKPASHRSSGAGAAAVASSVPLPLATPAALTPASTLLTPLSDSSRESGGPSCGPPSTAGAAAAAQRWQQQDYLAQIDKDLVGGVPCRGCSWKAGRAVDVAREAALPGPVLPHCLLQFEPTPALLTPRPAAACSTAPSRTTPPWMPMGAARCGASCLPTRTATRLWATARSAAWLAAAQLAAFSLDRASLPPWLLCCADGLVRSRPLSPLCLAPLTGSELPGSHVPALHVGGGEQRCTGMQSTWDAASVREKRVPPTTSLAQTCPACPVRVCG